MFQTDGFTVLKGLTNAVMQRGELLASNLANIETDNYVRQDIDFGRVLNDLKNNTTSDGNESILARSRYRDYTKPATLESELSQLYDNHLRYLLLVKSINHHFDHMRKALEVRAT